MINRLGGREVGLGKRSTSHIFSRVKFVIFIYAGFQTEIEANVKPFFIVELLRLHLEYLYFGCLLQSNKNHWLNQSGQYIF